MQKRPLGLTIIAWIALVGGVLGVASGIVVIAVGFYLPGVAVDWDLDELPPQACFLIQNLLSLWCAQESIL